MLADMGRPVRRYASRILIGRNAPRRKADDHRILSLKDNAMKIRLSALAGLLALSCIATVTTVSADETNNPGYWQSMMGGGWSGSGMMSQGGSRGYGPGMMWGQGGGMMGGCGMMGYRGSVADDHSYADGRIAFLKAELKITEAQNTVWNDYADALRTNSQIMITMHKQMSDRFKQDDHSALKFLDFHIQAMKSRLAALEALKPTTEALYKALSPDQRKKADDVLPAMGCI
jgi:hypothetical protein